MPRNTRKEAFKQIFSWVHGRQKGLLAFRVAHSDAVDGFPGELRGRWEDGFTLGVLEVNCQVCGWVGPTILRSGNHCPSPCHPPASFKSAPEPRIPGSLSSRRQVAARLPGLKSTFLLEGT